MTGSIVAEGAVAVNFAEVGEETLDVVESLRALRMAGQFGFLPGGLRRLHLFAQSVKPFLQLREFADGLPFIAGRGGFDLRRPGARSPRVPAALCCRIHELSLIAF